MKVKKYFIILVTILVILALVLFSLSVEKEAQTVVKEYLTKLYDINYEDINLDSSNAIKLSEEFKPYFTDKGYTKSYNNRDFLIPITSAKNGGYSLDLNDIELKKYSEEENGKLIYDYDLEMKLIYIDGTTSIITQHGQITLLNISGNWKINNDWVNLNEVIRENL